MCARYSGNCTIHIFYARVAEKNEMLPSERERQILDHLAHHHQSELATTDSSRIVCVCDSVVLGKEK